MAKKVKWLKGKIVKRLNGKTVKWLNGKKTKAFSLLPTAESHFDRFRLFINFDAHFFEFQQIDIIRIFICYNCIYD